MYSEITTLIERSFLRGVISYDKSINCLGSKCSISTCFYHSFCHFNFQGAKSQFYIKYQASYYIIIYLWYYSAPFKKKLFILTKNLNNKRICLEVKNVWGFFLIIMTFREEISWNMEVNIMLQSKSSSGWRINLLTPNSPHSPVTAK